MAVVPLAIGIGALALLMLTGKKKPQTPLGFHYDPVSKKLVPIAKPTKAPRKVAPAELLGPSVALNMSVTLKEEIAKVLRRLNVTSEGEVRPPIDKADIQVATALAGKLDRANFREAASRLRELISAAARYVPSPPRSRSTNLPGVSKQLRDRITRALQLERDPQKLSELLVTLKKLPASGERDTLVTSVESLVAQLAAAASTAETLEKTQAVLEAKSAKEPTPQTPLTRLAQQVAASMIAAESRYGVRRAKARRDVRLIARYQKAAKLTPDGKPGTKTLLSMAANGVSRLPLVLYWPRSATKRTVAAYRAKLVALARRAQQLGQTQRASQLAASAKREKGQGGIVRS